MKEKAGDGAVERAEATAKATARAIPKEAVAVIVAKEAKAIPKDPAKAQVKHN